jgi:tetratricopeptide (TPR) repeat protein
MVAAPISDLADVERWLRESRAGAARLLPALLDLPAPQLGAELERHPELRLGLVQQLLTVAENASERYPRRAYELTAVVVEHADIDVPPSLAPVVRHVRGRIWTVYASALRGIGRHAAAREAIANALALGREGLGSVWDIAAAEVVEAQILHEQGELEAALTRIRRAAAGILLHGDRARYVQVRMLECWMHWDAGHPAAAADVWRRIAAEASQRHDPVLLAQLETGIGIFELRHGTPEAAAGHFTAAHHAFETAGLTPEAIRARRNLAEALVARNRFHEAISEYYKVQALLLANGEVLDAAVASAEILELLLLAGREGEVLPLAERLVRTFTDAGMQLHALQAWTFVRGRAGVGELTREDIDGVRRYFEYLPLQPNARFRRPDGAAILIIPPATRVHELPPPKPALPAPKYPRSRAALGKDAQTQRIAAELESQAATRPYAQPPVGETMVRIIRSRRYGRSPAIRLFYSVDEEAVRLLWIEWFGR